jgi:hypothetical protein
MIIAPGNGPKLWITDYGDDYGDYGLRITGLRITGITDYGDSARLGSTVTVDGIREVFFGRRPDIASRYIPAAT